MKTFALVLVLSSLFWTVVLTHVLLTAVTP